MGADVKVGGSIYIVNTAMSLPAHVTQIHVGISTRSVLSDVVTVPGPDIYIQMSVQ